MKRHEVATVATAISVVPPSPQLDTAGRINYYHRLSREAGEVAIKAALAVGMELAKVQLSHPGNLFDAWVEANCEFSRRTAFRYKELAVEAFGHTDRYARLIEGSDDERREAVEEYAASTGSKSLTQLYVDLGIIRKSPGAGGIRPGAGRKRKLSIEEMQRQADALAKDPEAAWSELSALLAPVSAFIDARDGLGMLHDKWLNQLSGTFDRWHRRILDIYQERRKGGR